MATAPRFSSQNIANTLWGLVQLGHGAPRVFAALGNAGADRAGEMCGQHLANTVWACASAGQHTPRLFAAVAAQVGAGSNFSAAPRLHACLAALLCPMHPGSPCLPCRMIPPAAWQVEARGEELNAQELSMTAWAFSKAGLGGAALYGTLAYHADLRAYQHSPQGLATLMWAFARAGRCAPELFDTLTRVAGEEVDLLSGRDLASVVWAYAQLGYSPEVGPRRPTPA